MEAYLDKYHGVREYMKNVVEQAKKDGYVETIYGRRRELPELKSSNFNTRQFGERVALNMPIQGTAADIIKLAMNKVYRELKDKYPGSRLILQIHDELIIEADTEDKEEIAALLRRSMEEAVELSVKLTVDLNTSDNWYDLK
jgi:DNA polymerase-1